MTPFNHSLTDIRELIGYNQCLSDMLNYLSELTELKPEKRFIDSCDIVDKIAATANKNDSILHQSVGDLILKSIP